MKWQIIDSGAQSACQNMQLDAQWLTRASALPCPLIRFYDWTSPSGTYGCLCKPEQLLNLENCSKWGVELACRPTGGGILFHLTDFAFSCVVPAHSAYYSLNILQNYQVVNQIIKQAIDRFLGVHAQAIHLLPQESIETVKGAKHFCMAKPTRYDLLWNGLKIGGGAQRRTKDGFLHQGSISLSFPAEEFLNAVLKDTAILQAMKQHTGCLLPHTSMIALKEAKDELKFQIQTALKEEEYAQALI